MHFAEIGGDRLHRLEPGTCRLVAAVQVTAAARTQWERADAGRRGGIGEDVVRRGVAVGEAHEARRPMRLGGAGLAGHRQIPADGAGRARRGAAALVVLAQRVRERIRQSFGHRLVARRDGVRHLVAVAVEDLVDRVRRTPRPTGGQRRRHIGQLERVELKRPQGERPHVLPLYQVAQAFVACRVIGSRRRRSRVGAQPEPDRHVDRAGNAHLLNQLGERRVW